MDRERHRGEHPGFGRTRGAPHPTQAQVQAQQATDTLGVHLPHDTYPRWDHILSEFRRHFATVQQREGKKKEDYADYGTFFRMAAGVLTQHRADFDVTELQFDDLTRHLYNELFGYGVISLYLSIPGVEDILVDAHDRCDVIVRGQKHRVRPMYRSDQEVKDFLNVKVFAPLNKECNRENPAENAVLVDIRPDGSEGPASGARVFAFTDPISDMTGFTIRKHTKEVFLKAEDYMATGIAPPQFFADLREWVTGKRNIVISGATGSGKTTFVNFAAGLVPQDERIITLEDTPELQIAHPRVLSLHTYGRGSRAGVTGAKDVPMRDLLRYSLRLKPDRIVVGEVRDAETFDMLDALNTGHAGSFTTLHSNSPGDALMRLQMMAIRADVDVPISELKTQIGAVVDIVIQIRNLPGVGRKVVAAEQVIFAPHYQRWDEIGDRRDVYENVAMRTLWKWSKAQGQLVRVTDLYPPDWD